MHYIPAPESIELHLSSSPLFSKYAKKVKALGGRYTECRGHSHTRYVHLPLTSEGRSLANRLIAEFSARPATTVIARGVDSFRGRHVHAPVVVQRVSRSAADPCGDFLAAYESAFLRAFPDAAEPESQPSPADEKVVFVVDEERFDINCGRLVDETLASEKKVKFKHRHHAVAVHSRRCHDTLEAAKAALLGHIAIIAQNVRELEYDAENFWVA
jgi:hypothetical protein